MAVSNILAVDKAHPPDVNHCVVCSALVFEIVKYSSYVAMTIITTDIVHPLSVNNICLSDGFIILLGSDAFEFKFNILMCFTEGLVINRYIVWSSKVMNDAFRISNSGVSNDWNYLSKTWQAGPCYT